MDLGKPGRRFELCRARWLFDPFDTFDDGILYAVDSFLISRNIVSCPYPTGFPQVCRSPL